MTSTIGVSVCIFTYNYDKFLAQAIDSVLAQQTSFDVEIVIGDDCSTDNTTAIAMEYCNGYPGKIIMSFNDSNVGGTRNWIRTMNKCRGKYISLLDGDDYFTDLFKLQKQYDALDRSPDCVLSFHSVEEKYDDITGQDRVVIYEKEVYTIGDFLKEGWFVRTAATFFRNGIAPAEPPAWVYDFPYRYDTILHVFLCMHGKAICLKDVMSVWRKHSKGMSKSLTKNSIKNVQTEVALARQLDRYTDFKYSRQVKSYVAKSYSNLFFSMLKSKNRFGHIQILIQCLRYMDYGMTFRMVQNKLGGNKKA